LKINVRRAGRVTILDLDGALKFGAAEDAFREQMQQLMNSGPAYVAINLARVSDLDSSGIGVLVRMFSSVKRGGGRCTFFSLNARVQMVLRMVHLDNVLDISEDEASAIARF
jgi:anti-sigma B factor antagonist